MALPIHSHHLYYIHSNTNQAKVEKGDTDFMIVPAIFLFSVIDFTQCFAVCLAKRECVLKANESPRSLSLRSVFGKSKDRRAPTRFIMSPPFNDEWIKHFCSKLYKIFRITTKSQDQCGRLLLSRWIILAWNLRTITESSSQEVKLASSSNYCNASLARLLAASSRKHTINQSINQRFALKAFLELKTVRTDVDVDQRAKG